jgi:CD2 antigen cytoplasmic tail-binding protein 2
MDIDPSSSTKVTLTKSKIERLTALASGLLSLGDGDIYNKTYEHVLRSVRSSGDVEPDWVPLTTTYEYKWDVPETTTNASDPQVFGPFKEAEMKAWYDANYFGVSGEKVKVRVVGGEWGDWDDVVD